MIGNPMSYVRSYPPNIDVFTYASALFGSKGMDYTGKSIPTLPVGLRLVAVPAAGHADFAVAFRINGSQTH